MSRRATPEGIAHKLDVLRRHCDDVGRDYAKIQKTIAVSSRPTDAGAFAREMEPYAALGFDTVMVSPPGDTPAEWIETVGAPIVTRLAELP